MTLSLKSIFDARHTFSKAPLSFIDQLPRTALSHILDLIYLETGNIKDIKNWQKIQLHHLMDHSKSRSDFWRKRLSVADRNGVKIENLPILTRNELREQVEREGALIKIMDGVPPTKHSTSGSSGTPVSLYVTKMNANYNAYRSVAQLVMDEQELSLNMTKLGFGSFNPVREKFVTKKDHWFPDIFPFIETGKFRQLEYRDSSTDEIDKLVREMKKDSIGLLLCGPWMLEAVLEKMPPEELYRNGARICITYGAGIGPSIGNDLERAGINVSQSYSCEEVGPIAFECKNHKGYFHVATSNIIVETDRRQRMLVDGDPVEKILVTHLHSYASPLIRYEVGDYGNLVSGCRCGFAGPVLRNIYGRSKSLISRPDGSVSPFHAHALYLLKIADIKEFRIRQISPVKIIAEFVLKNPENTNQFQALKQKLESVLGQGMEIEVRNLGVIDWGNDTKRLGFKNELLSG